MTCCIVPFNVVQTFSEYSACATFGSIFLRSTGPLGSLASCPPKDSAVTILLAFKKWLSSQSPSLGCHIPGDQVAQGSCAAPFRTHLLAAAWWPSLPGWQVLLSLSAIQLQVSCLIGTLSMWDGTLPIFLEGGLQFPSDCCGWRFDAECALIALSRPEFRHEVLLYLAHLGRNTIANKPIKIPITYIKLIQHSVNIPWVCSICHIGFELSYVDRLLWRGWQLYPHPAQPGDPLFAQALSSPPQLRANSFTHLAQSVLPATGSTKNLLASCTF